MTDERTATVIKQAELTVYGAMMLLGIIEAALIKGVADSNLDLGIVVVTGALGRAADGGGVGAGRSESHRSNPAAITVTRTASPIFGSMAEPQMMLASSWATS